MQKKTRYFFLSSDYHFKELTLSLPEANVKSSPHAGLIRQHSCCRALLFEVHSECKSRRRSSVYSWPAKKAAVRNEMKCCSFVWRSHLTFLTQTHTRNGWYKPQRENNKHPHPPYPGSLMTSHQMSFFLFLLTKEQKKTKTKHTTRHAHLAR